MGPGALPASLGKPILPGMRADVVDLYHGDVVIDFNRTAKAGVKAIIHKATQGAGVTDHAYAERRKMATDAGLLWGAYHFNTGEAVDTQVQHFLDAAKPDDHTLMALDFEDNRHSQMTLAQARDFLARLDAALGRKAVIYSGNRIKDLLGSKVDTFFGSHRLWLAQYGPFAHVQASWSKYWLWQFTGDGIGQEPHSLPGIVTHGIDINQYIGDPDKLTDDWAGAPVLTS